MNKSVEKSDFFVQQYRHLGLVILSSLNINAFVLFPGLTIPLSIISV